VSGLVLMLCAGTPFMMAVFGSRIKAQFQLSQTVSAVVQTWCVAPLCVVKRKLISENPPTLESAHGSVRPYFRVSDFVFTHHSLALPTARKSGLRRVSSKGYSMIALEHVQLPSWRARCFCWRFSGCTR
jgi:hypothetical protein